MLGPVYSFAICTLMARGGDNVPQIKKAVKVSRPALFGFRFANLYVLRLKLLYHFDTEYQRTVSKKRSALKEAVLLWLRGSDFKHHAVRLGEAMAHPTQSRTGRETYSVKRLARFGGTDIIKECPSAKNASGQI